MEVVTSFGTFSEGEEIAVIMKSPCGRVYTYKGLVTGKRECRGKEFLVIKNDEGDYYDVAPGFSERILRGEEAARAIQNKLGRIQEEKKKEEEEKMREIPKYNRIYS